MESYKIRVNNEAESKEAQELFFELGYSWSIHGKTFNKSVENGSYIFPQSNYFLQHGLGLSSTEITFPQLRDLVVLKRNDVKDATHVDPGGTKHIELDGRWYWFHEESTPDIQFGWVESASYREYDDKVLKPIKQPQDPALISGREAWLAFFDGLHVQWSEIDREAWFNFKEEDWNTHSLKNDGFKFRLKPQTIKLELELPKPFEPKVGEWFYYLSAEHEDGYGSRRMHDDTPKYLMNLGAYRTEGEIKQIVEQLRKIKGAV